MTTIDALRKQLAVVCKAANGINRDEYEAEVSGIGVVVRGAIEAQVLPGRP